MSYNWLLFDADNTILDFNAAQRFALDESLESEGLEAKPGHHAIYDRINRECWRAYEDGRLSKQELRAKRFQLFFLEIGQRIDAREFGQQYLEHLSRSTAMIEGALELLKSLHADYRLALVTNGIKEVQRSRLALAGLEKYFELIVISDEIGVSKPNAGFFQHTFQQMDEPEKERTLIIGDNLNADIRGGRDFGIHTCWFNYDQRERYLEVEPTYEIEDLTELYQLL